MQPTLAQISQFFCLHFLSAGLQACATKPNRKIKFKQKVNDKPSYFNSLCLLPISSIINDKNLGALQVLLRIPQSLYCLAISNEFYETKITVLLLFLLQLLVPSSYTLSLYSIFFLASCDTLSGLHYLYKVHPYNMGQGLHLNLFNNIYKLLLGKLHNHQIQRLDASHIWVPLYLPAFISTNIT